MRKLAAHGKGATQIKTQNTDCNPDNISVHSVVICWLVNPMNAANSNLNQWQHDKHWSTQVHASRKATQTA
jgi:hypothetical protein